MNGICVAYVACSVREKSESANLPMLNVANYIHYATSFGPQVSHKLSQATAIYHLTLASKHGRTLAG